MELIILLVIAVFIITYRKNTGENVYKFFAKEAANVYPQYI